jgi:hypothetical protein
MVTVPGADRFSSSLAVATTRRRRALRRPAFSEFLFAIAREVYPRYEFAALSEAEFGASIALG